MPDFSESPPSFEAALEQLQAIVHDLEEGQLGLEPSLERFEEGVRLLKNCYAVLEQAEQRIEILTGVDAAGGPVVAPFDATATGTVATTEGKPGRRRSTAKRAANPEAPPEPETREESLF